jgi:hypothetical protein
MPQIALAGGGVSNRQRRTSRRTGTQSGARIVSNHFASGLKCTVRNISDTGACLVFGYPVAIPSEFELEIPSHGQFHRCQVRWSTGRTYGVKFLSALVQSATEQPE